MLRYGCGDHAQFFCVYGFFCAYSSYKVYHLVAVSLFATFALFSLQLSSIVFLNANKNKLQLKVLFCLVFYYLIMLMNEFKNF